MASKQVETRKKTLKKRIKKLKAELRKLKSKSAANKKKRRIETFPGSCKRRDRERS